MPQFANPAALWLLALILPVLLLYLLKQKRREITVPSILLWKQAVEDLSARTPFQKLRSNLLLLLQILIIVLLTALLSQPYLPSAFQESSRCVLVLDLSASMKTRDVKPNRFESAREGLLEILDSLSPADEVMLISFSSEARVLQTYTSANHSNARSKLLRLEPEDTPGDWKQLSLLLKPLLDESPRPRIVIASDFANFPADLFLKMTFEPFPVGVSGDNAGITRAAMQSLPEDPDNQMLFYQIRNFGLRGRNIELQIFVNDDVIDAYEIQIQPGDSAERSKMIRVLHPSKIKIQIKPEDVFPIDDDFVFHAYPQAKTRVRLKMNDPFTRKALRALPSIELLPSARIAVESSSTAPPASAYGIFFRSSQNNLSASLPVQWNSVHPALRFVDVSRWRFATQNAPVPPEATALIETATGIAAYAIDRPECRQIVLNFAVEDSNLPLLAGFPIFLQNSIEWIREGLDKSLPTLTGGEFKQEGAFTSLQRQGYANLADAGESDIAPAKMEARAGTESKSVAGRIDLSVWFLILLLGIAILEWWVFHQRMHAEA